MEVLANNQRLGGAYSIGNFMLVLRKAFADGEAASKRPRV